MKFFILVLCLIFLSGCGISGVIARPTSDGGIEIVPKSTGSWIEKIISPKLPTGDYEGQVEEFKKLKISTKVDMKIVDVNVIKAK